jgi:hypothetical protein
LRLKQLGGSKVVGAAEESSNTNLARTEANAAGTPEEIRQLLPGERAAASGALFQDAVERVPGVASKASERLALEGAESPERVADGLRLARVGVGAQDAEGVLEG